MKGYIEIPKAKYEVGKTYRIRDEETTIGSNTFMAGFYCIFETASKCRRYFFSRDKRSRIAEVETNIFYIQYNERGKVEYYLADNIKIINNR